MRAFNAVALREIVERRFVLVAAAAAAVIPFLVPLLPGVPADQAVLTRGVTALILACAFGVGGSLLVGASVVGRELAERRLSFHFSRPLPAPVVWAGKLVGGLTLVLLAELLVFLPASAAGGQFPGLPGLGLDAPALWAILLSAVPLFLLAWLGSVALRSRSPWLVADLVALVAIPAVAFLVGRRFQRYGGWVDPSAAAATATAILVAALLAATLAQVVVGRTDARRGHGAQSLVLWGVLLAATAAGAVWAERTIDPGVGRLVRAWAEAAGTGGDWVLLQGSARMDGGGASLYLLNLRNQKTLLLPMSWTSTVSADGSRAATVHASPSSSKEVELEAIDLKTGDSIVLELPAWPEGIDLSADGRRLAVIAGGICRVHELPSLRLLASARVPAGSSFTYTPRFVSPDRVRLHPFRIGRRTPDASTPAPRAVVDPEAAELDVTRKSVAILARYPVTEVPAHSTNPPGGLPPEPYFWLVPSPDLSRILLVGTGSAHSVRLLDASSGRVLASFDGFDETGGPRGVYLADGRVVVLEPAPEGRRLVLLSSEGIRLSEIALPAGMTRFRLGHEPRKGALAIGLAREKTAERLESWIADFEGPGLRRIGGEVIGQAFWSDGLRFPPAGSPATRLAHDESYRLVLYDPATGSQTPLTRGRPAGK